MKKTCFFTSSKGRENPKTRKIFVNSYYGTIHKSKAYHCVKSIQVQSLFWSVLSCIQTEYRKTKTRKNSVFGHFSRSVCRTLPAALSYVSTISQNSTREIHLGSKYTPGICPNRPPKGTNAFE